MVVQCKQLYVYVDYRLDTNEPFYVGMGSRRRVDDFDSTARNAHHGRIVAKYGLLRVDVPFSFDWETTCVEEKRLIKSLNTYTPNNPKGANETLGGDGGCGSLANKGKKKPPRTLEHNARNATSRMGQKRPQVSIMMKGNKNGIGNRSRANSKQSPDEIAKRAASLRGQKRSDETRAKMRVSALKREARRQELIASDK